jgi:hypothetical protein
MRIFGIDPLMLGRGEWSDIDRIGFGLGIEPSSLKIIRCGCVIELQELS